MGGGTHLKTNEKRFNVKKKYQIKLETHLKQKYVQHSNSDKIK
jgi:hypothetical protein